MVNYQGDGHTGNSIDYFRLLTELSTNLNWIRTFFHRAATCRSEGRPYTEEFGEEEWKTAMETLSDVAIKVLGYAHTRNGIMAYFEEYLPVYDDPELWNLFEPTYTLEHTPDLAMSITSPLMELVRSIGGDLEAEIEAELDREEFYKTLDNL